MNSCARRASARFVDAAPDRPIDPTSTAAMLTATCHCGAVRVEVPHPPQSLTHCDCSICRRYGALWAYYKASETRVVAAPGATARYAWGDRSIAFVRCATCGCVMGWEPVSAQRTDRMGVNARNFDRLELGSVTIRFLDGSVTEQNLPDEPRWAIDPVAPAKTFVPMPAASDRD